MSRCIHWILCGLLLFVSPAHGDDVAFPETLPGTEPLTMQRPLDEVMVEGLNRFALRALENSREQRAEKWQRDYSSPEAYAKSVAENRERFRTIIGAVDERVTDRRLETPPFGVETAAVGVKQYQVVRVRWYVLDGMTAEGVFLAPNHADEVKGFVVALPDANWTPEMFVGLEDRVPPQAQLARQLAENGYFVLVPTLINRDDTYSGHPDIRDTNQPHREFVYRMAFEMGRHIIGYEVQKVLAAVDEFERLNKYGRNKGKIDRNLPIAVVGIGEGGLLALYSAAVDPRIDACLVSGYFEERENVWQEPIYRNVWSLLTEFGDADIASLVAPRPLIVEAAAAPAVDGPPEPRDGRRDCAAPGKIEIPELDSVRREFERAEVHYEKLGIPEKLTLAVSGDDGTGLPGTDEALSAFLKGLGIDDIETDHSSQSPRVATRGLEIDVDKRQKRQFDQLVDYTQKLMHQSAKVRDEFWSKADRSSVDAWTESTEFYRNYIHEEMIGKLPKPTMPLNVRSRKILDEPNYQGYEVVIDVYPDVIAGGILLLPADLKEGEKRPVVVCQHGLEGTPMDTITTNESTRAWRAYKGFSTQLVQRGFIVFAPQNPYRGGDRFRSIQRKSNPMKRSLFSYIIRQHERILEWLSALPYVDPDRIGFYGLSYGGKTAVRVPPILQQYALSICSADFNEWVRKNVSATDRYSYMFTGEYEMFEWNLGHVANYAELASLMTPRPFMVERGHHDGVAPDEWVGWEYAKVRRHYDLLEIGDRTEIEWFNGPHTINGEGTFDFLHRHLDWPKP